MTELQTELPVTHSLGDSWGLGWIRFGWDSQRLFGHDGNTIGQSAYLRVLPEQGLAVTLLTNGGGANDLYEDLFREIFADLAGVAMPQPLTPPSKPIKVELHHQLGSYDRAGTAFEVIERGGSAVLRQTPTGPASKTEPTQEFELVPADASGDLFLIRRPHWRTWTPVTFYRLPTGGRFMNIGVRSTPKVD